MSNVRIFWIIWCSFWALFWLIVGFATFGVGWVGVPVSLVMILIPIGSNNQGKTIPQVPPWGLPPSIPGPHLQPQSPYDAAAPGSPGWYPDPVTQRMRWWDGQGWGN